MLSLFLKFVLFVAIVAVPPGLFSQSPSTSPEPKTSNSDAKSGNTGTSGNAASVKSSCAYSPNPAYTKEAMDAKFEGVVRVEAIVMPDGRVTNIRILNSPGWVSMNPFSQP